jgi:hypothetical protein
MENETEEPTQSPSSDASDSDEDLAAMMAFQEQQEPDESNSVEDDPNIVFLQDDEDGNEEDDERTESSEGASGSIVGCQSITIATPPLWHFIYALRPPFFFGGLFVDISHDEDPSAILSDRDLFAVVEIVVYYSRECHHSTGSDHLFIRDKTVLGGRT